MAPSEEGAPAVVKENGEQEKYAGCQLAYTFLPTLHPFNSYKLGNDSSLPQDLLPSFL